MSLPRLPSRRVERKDGPEPGDPAEFTDVPEGAYYAEAVRWAAEGGVTGGTAPGVFSPDLTCTRAQVVAFLYRAPAAPRSPPALRTSQTSPRRVL